MDKNRKTQIPTLQLSTNIAVKISENLNAQEQAFFVAGFQECIKFLEGGKHLSGVDTSRINSNILKDEYITTDMYGYKLKEGERFSFKYVDVFNKSQNLTGSFRYNNTELRYEIDIEKNSEFTCIAYVSDKVSDIEVLD